MVCRPAGRFSRRSRVRRRAEFRRIQSLGLKVVLKRFVFLMLRGPSDEAPKLGVTASRRVGNAVTRNRAKRLVREAFRATRDLWSNGVELVVIVRRSLDDVKLQGVVEEWQEARLKLARCQARLAAPSEPSC